MWILIAFSPEDPSRHTCLFPSSWNLRRTPLGRPLYILGRDWGMGTERMFWEYLAGVRSWGPASTLEWSFMLPWAFTAWGAPPSPRLKIWDKGTSLRCLMLTVVVIPEITKGAESSIIYLPVHVSFQMDLLFFFLSLTLRIFSLIFLFLLEISPTWNKTQHSAGEKARV